MTEHDAERLAEIRRGTTAWRDQRALEAEFLLRLYDAMVAERDALRHKVADLYTERDTAIAERDALAARAAEVTQERDLLNAALGCYSDEQAIMRAQLAAAHGLQSRAERAEAALADARSALQEIGKKALHWQAVCARNEISVHRWRDIQMRAQGAARAALAVPS